MFKAYLRELPVCFQVNLNYMQKSCSKTSRFKSIKSSFIYYIGKRREKNLNTELSLNAAQVKKTNVSRHSKH